VPFKSARATHLSRPTGLADGLELESTPTRNGESAPRHSRQQCRANAMVPPLPHLQCGIRLHVPYYRYANRNGSRAMGDRHANRLRNWELGLRGVLKRSTRSIAGKAIADALLGEQELRLSWIHLEFPP
jgi:hypothetical protein